MLPYCQAHDITVIAHTPLALGAFESGPEAEIIGRVAAEADRTPAQIMIRWLLEHERVVAPIPKTEWPARVDELCGAAGWSLAPEHRAALDAIGG